MSDRHNSGQNHNIKILVDKTRTSSENAAKLRYLETTVTNQNLIREENKKRIKSGNACYRSVV
jgi:hypothetical protein